MVYDIGPGELKKLAASIEDGDIIRLHAGVYSETVKLNVEGQVMIEGVDHPTFDGRGLQIANPRAFLHLVTGDWTIKDVNFQYGHNGDINAAAVYNVHGSLTLEQCEISNLDMGVMSSEESNSVIVRDCHIHHCGHGPKSHNIYTSGGHLSVIGGTIRDSVYGQNIKTRTKTASISGCRVMRGADGELGFVESEATASPESDVLVENCTIVSRKRASNANQLRFIEFGREGKPDTDRNGDLTLINNRLVANDDKIRFINIRSETARLYCIRNEFRGSKTILETDPVETAKHAYGYANVFEWNADIPEGFEANKRDIITSPARSAAAAISVKHEVLVPVGTALGRRIILSWHGPVGVRYTIHKSINDGPMVPYGETTDSDFYDSLVFVGKKYKYQVVAESHLSGSQVATSEILEVLA